MGSLTIDGYGILTARDGSLYSIQDVDAVVDLLGRDEIIRARLSWFLLQIAGYCEKRNKSDLAGRYIEEAIGSAEDPAWKADCILVLGQFHERCRNYPAAVEAYSRAFVFPNALDDTRYFLHNNLGYSLNQLGRFEEAEKYCRAAIRIDPQRHNAYKNLGISLQGLGKHPEAASFFFIATRICPHDKRALAHLEELVVLDPSLERDHPMVRKRLLECRNLAGQPSHDQSH